MGTAWPQWMRRRAPATHIKPRRSRWSRRATLVHDRHARRGPYFLAALTGSPILRNHSLTVRSRSALATTLTEDSAMAAAAITGDSRMPATG